MLIKKEYKNIPLDELESMSDYQRPLNHTSLIVRKVWCL